MLNLARSITVAATLLAAFGTADPAAAQLVTNGGFETFTTGSGGDRGFQSGYGSLSGWTLSTTNNFGYAGIITSSNANSSYTANGVGITLANPGNTSGVPSITVASGNNMLAWENAGNTCGCYIYQTITGLVQNASYTLSFSEAGAVWSGGASAATSDRWMVGWGTSASNSVANQAPSQTVSLNGTTTKGFTGWVQQQMSLVATSTTMVLSFMANHPTGVSQPPFALLDGVTLTQTTTVPEPASALLVISAIGGMIGLRRAARRRG